MLGHTRRLVVGCSRSEWMNRLKGRVAVAVWLSGKVRCGQRECACSTICAEWRVRIPEEKDNEGWNTIKRYVQEFPVEIWSTTGTPLRDSSWSVRRETTTFEGKLSGGGI